jgi:hypothetical protein
MAVPPRRGRLIHAPIHSLRLEVVDGHNHSDVRLVCIFSTLPSILEFGHGEEITGETSLRTEEGDTYMGLKQTPDGNQPTKLVETRTCASASPALLPRYVITRVPSRFILWTFRPSSRLASHPSS